MSSPLAREQLARLGQTIHRMIRLQIDRCRVQAFRKSHRDRLEVPKRRGNLVSSGPTSRGGSPETVEDVVARPPASGRPLSRGHTQVGHAPESRHEGTVRGVSTPSTRRRGSSREDLSRCAARPYRARNARCDEHSQDIPSEVVRLPPTIGEPLASAASECGTAIRG